MALVTDFMPSAAPVKNRIAAYLADFVEASQKRAVYRTTVSELQNLSNRELADLGIGRGEIRAIARETAYGK